MHDGPRGPKESQVGGCRVRYSQRQSVLVVELLSPISAAELTGLSRSIAKYGRLLHTAQVLLDVRVLRAGGSEPRDRAFRDALTEWAIAQTEPLALVVDDELQVAEINMASLGRGASVRAFSSTADAFRHVTRAPSRPSSESGISGRHRAVSPSTPPGASDRRALLFPRRPSEAAILRAAPITPPTRDE